MQALRNPPVTRVPANDSVTHSITQPASLPRVSGDSVTLMTGSGAHLATIYPAERHPANEAPHPSVAARPFDPARHLQRQQIVRRQRWPALVDLLVAPGCVPVNRSRRRPHYCHRRANPQASSTPHTPTAACTPARIAIYTPGSTRRIHRESTPELPRQVFMPRGLPHCCPDDEFIAGKAQKIAPKPADSIHRILGAESPRGLTSPGIVDVDAVHHRGKQPHVRHSFREEPVHVG